MILSVTLLHCHIAELFFVTCGCALFRKMYSTDFATGASVSTSSAVSDHDGKFVLDPDLDTFWQATADDKQMSVTLKLAEHHVGSSMMNVVMLQEYLPEGQRVAGHEVTMSADGNTWKSLVNGTTIGHKRLFRLQQDMPVPALIRVQVTGTAFSVGSPALSRIGLLYADPLSK